MAKLSADKTKITKFEPGDTIFWEVEDTTRTQRWTLLGERTNTRGIMVNGECVILPSQLQKSQAPAPA